ncbi:MAG: ATP-grasp domain-containing protein [Alphaproteobacteria bacterium GM7ARS4]|nr:ATP-grasp domain-containing protein [Alphaproteobacteria bacterium GM7ARS4]
MPAPHIVVFSDDASMPPSHHAKQDKGKAPQGYHQRTLTLAAQQHRLTIAWMPYRCCVFNTHSPYGLSIDDGDSERLPRAVFARFIAAGSLQELTFSLSVLHAFTACGVPVLNQARTIERTVDKGLCAHILQRHHIPIPLSITCASPQHIHAIRQTYPLKTFVYKPLFGAQGKGLQKIRPNDPIPQQKDTQGVWHMQEYIESDAEQGWFQDWRVFIVDGKIVSMMRRKSRTWITNVSQGALCIPDYDHDIGATALNAARCLLTDYAGIDIIRNRQKRPLVLEVNSIPAWQGIEQKTTPKIAASLITMAKKRMEDPSR